MVCDVLTLRKDRTLNAVRRANVVHFDAFRQQLRQKRQVRRYMAGGTAACQDDLLFHQ